MTAQNHYDSHLAHFYEWLTGDFEVKQDLQQDFFERNGIKALQNRMAIDLGSGHGLQSISLAKIGFQVKAIDFSKQLLESLQVRGKQLGIEVFQREIMTEENFREQAEVIVCMGDTIAHLESVEQIRSLFSHCWSALLRNGKLILSYRDYGLELHDTQRFIPVKADEDRILTCCLEYFDDKVRVTDLLHEKIDGQWVQRASSYLKIRITNQLVEQWLTEVGFKIGKTEIISGVNYLIARKQ
jgi:hypothetical protein